MREAEMSSGVTRGNKRPPAARARNSATSYTRRAATSAASSPVAGAVPPGRSITIRCQRSTSSRQRRHVASPFKASMPMMSASGVSPSSSRSESTVSTMYEGPGRRSSRSSTRSRGSPLTARRSMVSRCSACARGAARWGGTPQGMSRTGSRPSSSSKSIAGRRWPKWMGSKVPPRRPIMNQRAPAMREVQNECRRPVPCKALLPDMPLPQHDELLTREPFESDRSAHVYLVGADADLRTETVFEAIGETRRGVHHHRARIHLAQETPRARVILGDDGVGVLRAVALDVGERRIEIGAHAHREDGRQEFRAPIAVARGLSARHEVARARTAAQLDAFFQIHLTEARQHLRRNLLRHQQGLHGVAGAVTLGLGIEGDGDRLVEGGLVVDVDVADAVQVLY